MMFYSEPFNLKLNLNPNDTHWKFWRQNMAWKRLSQMSAVKPRFGVRASYSKTNFGSNQRLRSQTGRQVTAAQGAL